MQTTVFESMWLKSGVRFHKERHRHMALLVILCTYMYKICVPFLIVDCRCGLPVCCRCIPPVILCCPSGRSCRGVPLLFHITPVGPGNYWRSLGGQGFKLRVMCLNLMGQPIPCQESIHRSCKHTGTERLGSCHYTHPACVLGVFTADLINKRGLAASR